MNKFGTRAAYYVSVCCNNISEIMHLYRDGGTRALGIAIRAENDRKFNFKKCINSLTRKYSYLGYFYIPAAKNINHYKTVLYGCCLNIFSFSF